MNIKLNSLFIATTLSCLLITSCNKKEGYKDYSFKYWNDSTSLTLLKDYVKDVTNVDSNNYIPKDRRIVTFDVDGTLYGERGPIYVEWMMFNEFYSQLYSRYPDDERLSKPMFLKNEYEGDDTTKISVLVYPVDVYKAIEEFKKTRVAPKIYDFLDKDEKCFVTLETAEAYMGAQLFSGFTIDKYKEAVNNYLTYESPCFNNLVYRDSFFLPMIEVFEFLQLNEFDVFVVSGTDRLLLRELLKNYLKFNPGNVIGTDVKIEINWQTGEAVRTPVLLNKSIKKEKVSLIIQEIGQRPVLSFGNSYGDIDMHDYTISEKNEYRSLAFMVLADDNDREFGYPSEEIEKRKQDWKSSNYNIFSMKNDWKTIYGDNVTIKL